MCSPEKRKFLCYVFFKITRQNRYYTSNHKQNFRKFSQTLVDSQDCPNSNSALMPKDTWELKNNENITELCLLIQLIKRSDYAHRNIHDNPRWPFFAKFIHDIHDIYDIHNLSKRLFFEWSYISELRAWGLHVSGNTNSRIFVKRW